jgi:prevent-host-death family protein
MTRTVSISDAKSHLSELVGRMMYAGDHVIIERHGKAVSVMIPIEDYLEFEKLKRERNSSQQDNKRQEVMPGIVNRS